MEGFKEDALVRDTQTGGWVLNDGGLITGMGKTIVFSNETIGFIAKTIGSTIVGS